MAGMPYSDVAQSRSLANAVLAIDETNNAQWLPHDLKNLATIRSELRWRLQYLDLDDTALQSSLAVCRGESPSVTGLHTPRGTGKTIQKQLPPERDPSCSIRNSAALLATCLLQDCERPRHCHLEQEQRHVQPISKSRSFIAAPSSLDHREIPRARSCKVEPPSFIVPTTEAESVVMTSSPNPASSSECLASFTHEPDLEESSNNPACFFDRESMLSSGSHHHFSLQSCRLPSGSRLCNDNAWIRRISSVPEKEKEAILAFLELDSLDSLPDHEAVEAKQWDDLRSISNSPTIDEVANRHIEGDFSPSPATIISYGESPCLSAQEMDEIDGEIDRIQSDYAAMSLRAAEVTPSHISKVSEQFTRARASESSVALQSDGECKRPADAGSEQTTPTQKQLALSSLEYRTRHPILVRQSHDQRLKETEVTSAVQSGRKRIGRRQKPRTKRYAAADEVKGLLGQVQRLLLQSSQDHHCAERHRDHKRTEEEAPLELASLSEIERLRLLRLHNAQLASSLRQRYARLPLPSDQFAQVQQNHEEVDEVYRHQHASHQVISRDLALREGRAPSDRAQQLLQGEEARLNCGSRSQTALELMQEWWQVFPPHLRPVSRI